MPELLMKWTDAIAQEQDLEGKMRIRSQAGTFRWHLVRAIPIRDTENHVIKWFGTHTDIHDFTPNGSTTIVESTSSSALNQLQRASDESNHLLAGRYQMLERLGSGANGTVHKALHMHLEKNRRGQTNPSQIR